MNAHMPCSLFCVYMDSQYYDGASVLIAVDLACAFLAYPHLALVCIHPYMDL